MIPITRAARRIAMLACAVLYTCTDARAQAIDTFNPGANQIVESMAIQPDGKILVGGGFTGLGGGTGATVRNHIGRLNADGTVDLTFNPGTDSVVHAIAVQPDGKILIGGNFNAVGGGIGTGTSRNRIARLNADGTVDTTFNPGANDSVYAIIVQPDGKILVGGEFSKMGGGGLGTTARSRLARLNPDGSLDSFDPGVSKVTGSAIVYTMALQEDGKILVGGYFNGLGGGTGSTTRNYIGRINADGTLDAGFNPGASSIGGVNALAVQSDGKIVVGGTFIGLGNGTGAISRLNLGRLNTDGSVDLSFNPGAEAQVLTLGVQLDGRILVGGGFKWLGGGGGVPNRFTRNYIGRINVDGSVDAGFDPGAGNWVNGVALRPDGSVMAVGIFSTLGGGTGTATPRSFIGRITNTGAAFDSLTLTNGGRLETWTRSGTGPEVSRVTFEFSFDNSFYSLLGSGTRVPGGWQLNSVNLPPRSYIRARGYYGTGFQTGSGSIVEQILPPTVFGIVSASPISLNFAATKAGAAGALTAVTPGQTVTVTIAGGGGSWTASADQPWVQIANGSGNGAGQFTASIVNPNNILGGSTSASATITVSAPTTINASASIPVALTIVQSGAGSLPPFGQVDTPVQNAAGVVGAIGVTGWALDNVGVTSVKIYRNCVAFEPVANCQTIGGNSVVFIGDAAFVAGARPDVEAAFSSFPQAYRAGWGYLLLTNMLPHVPNNLGFGGQGPLTLFAFATDAEGNVKLLGRAPGDLTPTSITMANDTIAKPFGAIDTPAQGGTAGGSTVNFGWVLTPDSNTSADATDIVIPTDGSTMVVFIDGVAVGIVAYNQCRGTVGNPVRPGLFCDDDVADIFGSTTPLAAFTSRGANATRYRNLDVGRAAIGAFVIDTTALANGSHSLAWGVSDSAARVEGIGSRNFVVLNSGASVSQTSSVEPQTSNVEHQAQAGADARQRALDELTAAPAMPRGLAASLAQVPIATATVWGRTGFDEATARVPVPVDASGVRHVGIPELGRLDMQIGGVDRAPSFTGFLVANGTLRDLPAGSHLDAATGVFTWAPGPGFIGTYRLTFVVAGTQVPIDVTIRPAGTVDPTQGAVRMFIDAPSANAVVHGQFTIAGWALDPQAAIGSGIDAVHVWAKLADSDATAFFLGAAALEGARPDVAAAFGGQFDRTGYGLIASMPVGEYDVIVYAHSARTGRWEDARVVHVTIR